MHAHMHVGSPPSSRCGYIVYRDLNDFSWQLLLSRSSLCSRKTIKYSSVPHRCRDFVCSKRVAAPERLPRRGIMGSCYSACPVVLFFGFFSLPPTQLLLLLHNVNTPLPATPPIRRSYTKPRCQPLCYRAGLWRHGGHLPCQIFGTCLHACR
jgi:hypothetical protein